MAASLWTTCVGISLVVVHCGHSRSTQIRSVTGRRLFESSAQQWPCGTKAARRTFEQAAQKKCQILCPERARGAPQGHSGRAVNSDHPELPNGNILMERQTPSDQRQRPDFLTVSLNGHACCTMAYRAGPPDAAAIAPAGHFPAVAFPH